MILPLLACLTLVGASSAPLAVSSLPFGNEPLPQCVVYNDVDQEITLSIDDVNNFTFENTFNAITDYDLTFGIFYPYEELTFTYVDFDGEAISWRSDNSYIFISNVDPGSPILAYQFYLDNLSTFQSGLVFDCVGLSAEEYGFLKNSLVLDLPSSGMSGVEVVGEIVDILAGGLTSLGSSIGAGVATFAQSLAFTDGHLSVYFVLVIAFAGVALAVGLTTLIFRWLTNLGN